MSSWFNKMAMNMEENPAYLICIGYIKSDDSWKNIHFSLLCSINTAHLMVSVEKKLHLTLVYPPYCPNSKLSSADKVSSKIKSVYLP